MTPPAADLTIELLDESSRPAVLSMLDEVEHHDGHPPLSEAKSLGLRKGRGVGLVGRHGEVPVGYAHLAESADAWDLQIAVHPAHRERDDEGVDEIREALARRAMAEVGERGGALLRLWAFRATDDDDAMGRRVGLERGRELLQMRRPLPHPDDPETPDDVVLREFVPGQDDADWLAVNARAFADHPDQGLWTPDDLQARFEEPWFDARGFLLADRDGELVGFCWTKVHERQHLGEIYVIGTDPDHRGEGLGKALTIAGLDALSRAGMPAAMLYVEADNDAAIALYEKLGFDVDHVDRVYEGSP